MQRLFETVPAFDKRHSDPERDYGIHGVEFRWVLKGRGGASCFTLFTMRHLKHVQMEQLVRVRHEQPDLSDADADAVIAYSNDFTKGKEVEELLAWHKLVKKLELENTFLYEPMPADLGFHSPVPMYEGQEPIRYIYRNMKFDPSQAEGEFVPPVYGDPVICPYLDGEVPCYYDGSSLVAKKVYKRLLEEGEEGIWRELKDYYEANVAEEYSL